MLERQTPQVASNRDVLKAFYTQYVAVLLIVLVFCVGAFQRSTKLVLTHQGAVTTTKGAPAIATLRVSPEFDDNGGLVVIPAELSAAVALVREHDVRARIELHIGHDDGGQELSAIERSLAQIESLRAYLLSDGLNNSDLTFALTETKDALEHVSINFEEVPRERHIL